MKILADLFMTFFKIGLFTFGGGYAMIPLLQAELVRKKKWSSDEELMDYYCIGQSTPGIIAINVATFIGYKRARSTGAVAATLGMVSPSLIIIMSLAHVLNMYMDNPYVAHAFAGIRIVVAALIAEAVFSLWKKAVRRKTDWAVFCWLWLRCWLLTCRRLLLYFWRRLSVWRSIGRRDINDLLAVVLRVF